MSGKYIFLRNYLKVHLWLRSRCDRLSIGQRKAILYGLSMLYFICSCIMIAQFFIPQKQVNDKTTRQKLIDSPIHRDIFDIDSIYINNQHTFNNGKKTKRTMEEGTYFYRAGSAFYPLDVVHFQTVKNRESGLADGSQQGDSPSIR